MTENKATSNTENYVIKPVSASESKNAIKESKKLQVKNAIINKLNEAITTASKSVEPLLYFFYLPDFSESIFSQKAFLKCFVSHC